MPEPVRLTTIDHFGVRRQYFASASLQSLYERISNRKLVTSDTIAFLTALGVEVEGTTT